MASVMDTHRIVKRLRDAGASEPLAETVADVLKENREAPLGDLATKADLAQLDGRLAQIDGRLAAYATKAELAEAKADVIKWVVGMGFAQVAMILAVLKLFPGGTP